MECYLPVIWAGLIGVAVAMYVILDGFDLGIGILFPAFKNDRQRDLMVNTVAPFWDGNETWLVLGGGGLWVAFPRAYAVLMPAMYLPVILMLLALVLRGVAFEFRTVARTSKEWWNRAFWLGSTVAGFFQGVILGGLIQGIRVVNGEFASGPFDWATPFAAICGVGVVVGYALLGSTWLVMKTEGEVAARSRTNAKWLILAVLGFMGIVSIWTPLAVESIRTRWFTPSNFVLLWPVPVVTALLAWLCWMWLEKGREVLPFFAAIGLFLLGYLGLVISWYPYIVPPSLTVWDTAAAPSSQIFVLVGVLLLLPIILGYIGFVYYIFRGKVREGEGYH
jgi:cytochrome bd ubiquinol oxidase subunit II